jgi:type I restriction enzyme S subunit
MNNVTTSGRFDWSEFVRVPADPETISEYRLQPGDVLFNNTNSTELVGKTALFLGHDEPVVFSNHFTRLRSNPDVLAPGFLAYWLQSQWQEDVFANICNRWVGQSAVQRDKLLALELPLPSLPEQERIVSILQQQLAAVERARAAAEARLEAARALGAAYLRRVFAGADARGWAVTALGDVGEIVSGVTLGRVPTSVNTREVPYLRVANVKDGFLDLTEVYRIRVTETEFARWRLEPGDLLLTEGGDRDKLGRGTIWKGEIPDCVHQNHIFRVRFDRARVLPEFASAQVGSAYGKAYFLAHAKQTTGIATINQKVLRAFPLRLPALGDQLRIVERLAAATSAASEAVAPSEAELSATQSLPASLLRRAFSGQV